MQISDFPRPPDDNGRGIHWSARIYHPAGQDLDFWIGALVAMHIKWVKLLDDGDGSSLELCQRLIDAGIMPVVRLFRERPNPGRVGGREISGLRKLVAAGVRYFETNNEPDLPAEWRGSMPRNWLDIVTDNFIYDADMVLQEGGLPAVPAMGPGGQENVIAKVVERDRKDLFERGAWLAIHNYTLNHPLDYPDDDVNQKGTPLTQEEYARLPLWAWDDRPLEMINQLREERKNPGDTIMDDPNCFRAWEYWGQRVHDALGFYIPVISTEGGPVVGWGDDKRYPKVTPDQQAEWQIAITRFFQEQAPEWYFSCCTWLLASRPLGDWNPTWEQMSWYTDAWNERFGLAGQLPIVQMMVDLPPVTRPELRRGTAALDGQVVRADTGAPLAHVPVEVESMGGPGHFVRRFQVHTDADGRIRLDRLPAGRYRLLVFNTEMSEFSVAENEQKRLTIRVQAGRRSRVFGQVTDANGEVQPGLVVTLHQMNPLRRLAETQTDAEGRYAFDELGAGRVLVRVAPGTHQATEHRDVVLDGWEAEEVDVVVPPAAGLRYEVVRRRLLSPEETGNNNLIFGQVLDQAGDPLDGVTVRLRWTGAAPDTDFPTVKSGQSPFKPRGYFEFIHTPGVFLVDILDDEHVSAVAENLVTADMPERKRPIAYEVVFQLRPTLRPTRQSAVGGRILGAAPGLAVTLSGGGQDPQVQRLDAQRRFRFGDLPAGVYQVSLEGVGIIAEDVLVNGSNRVDIEFPMLGQIAGQVLPPNPRAAVALSCEHYSIREEAETDDRGIYRFTGLPADTYTLRLRESSLPARQVECDGRTPLDGPVFDREKGEQSEIQGQIVDHRGQPLAHVIVWLRASGRRVEESQTDNDGRYRFAGLGAGRYGLEIVGRGLVATGIDVDGSNRVTQDVALPAPARSVIQGRLIEADGAPVPHRPLLLMGPTTRRGATDAGGAFRFESLQAGSYTLRVADTPAVKAQVELAAEETGEVTLQLPGDGASGTTSPIGHYLLITSDDPATVQGQLTLALDYILHRGVTVGFDPDACTQAKRVTVVGPVASPVAQALEQANVPVQRVSGDLSQLQSELEALP